MNSGSKDLIRKLVLLVPCRVTARHWYPLGQNQKLYPITSTNWWTRNSPFLLDPEGQVKIQGKDTPLLIATRMMQTRGMIYREQCGSGD